MKRIIRVHNKDLCTSMYCTYVHLHLYRSNQSLLFESKTYRIYRGRIQRKTWCMEPYAGVDYNPTLRPLQSQFQHIYHGQPYVRVDFMPQSETLDLASVQYCNVWINKIHRGTMFTCSVVSCTHHYIHSQHMYRWKVFAIHLQRHIACCISSLGPVEWMNTCMWCY
jgi:hypothetical protein